MEELKNERTDVRHDPQPPPSYDHMYASDDESDTATLAESKPTEPSSNKTEDYASYAKEGKGLDSSARILQNGRIDVALELKQKLPDLPKGYANDVREFAVDPSLGLDWRGDRNSANIPRLSIVIMIVGSRGDVQPFLALGQELLAQGHRVRIATHGTFRSFVTDAGLEFYNIGGDPHDLMSYMVKNPGLMPGWESLTNGDIGRKRKMLGQILAGCWEACTQPDEERDGDIVKGGPPFMADAIISNPPAFAHVHCAEALGIPLLLSFTMPWCSTTAFPHPLVNISQSNCEQGLTNYFSYAMADLMTWKGLGDVINKFRARKLGLEPLSVRSGPGLVDRLKVPWTYCFSPDLVQKPEDWSNHIDVVGFYFLNLASNYTPAPDLVAFLEAGPPPIYIGFGSVVVEDPAKLTQIIFEATAQAGVRVLLSIGWGGLGFKDDTPLPPHIFLLGNVPHDWLFTKVFAVCHHGGAGTTAIGLRLGKPTIVVPFFGDQPFWGAMIHRAGAGPKPILKEKMDVERLKNAILFCATDEARRAAEKMGEQIRMEDGVKRGVESFHRHLPLLNMRCDLLPDRLAVWWSTQHCLKLSAYAVEILSEERLINIHKLEVHRPKEYDSRARASDPLTGGVIEVFRIVTNLSTSIPLIFYSPCKGLINTTVAIPRGVMAILDSFTDGLNNTPKLYGSTTREPGRVKNFTTGMKEGGKALVYGVYDGVTGIVTEPYEGYKKEGLPGLFKGAARSYMNAGVKPAAGAVALVTYPLRGAMVSWEKATSTAGKVLDRHVRQLRTEQGKADIVPLPSSSSHRHVFHTEPTDGDERKRVIEAFRQACKKYSIVNRRQEMEERVKMLVTEGGAGTISIATKQESDEKKLPPPPLPPRPSSSANSQFTPTATVVAEEQQQWGEEEEKELELVIEEVKQMSLKEASGGVEEGVDEDTKHAMELSLAEQEATRTYEEHLLKAAAKWREQGDGEHVEDIGKGSS